MDDSRYRLREFRDEDYVADARLSTLIDPSNPTTAEEQRHWDRSIAAPHRANIKLVVEDRASGAVVATGALQHGLFNYHPRKYWTGVQVDPDHRRRGIGQGLYEVLEHRAAERDGVALWGSVRAEDPAGVRFLERQGFVEVRRVWVSRLEIAEADLSTLPDRSVSLAAEGIRFSTLAEEGADRPEVRRRLYQLWDTSAEDVPIVGERTSVPFEQFVRFELERPNFDAAATFLAIHGDEYVGMTSNEVVPGDPQTLRIGFTGTLRAYRGRGVATELKRRAVEYARIQGYRYLRTGNDSLNRPIWAINERLGFRREKTWINAEKALSGKR